MSRQPSRLMSLGRDPPKSCFHKPCLKSAIVSPGSVQRKPSSVSHSKPRPLILAEESRHDSSSAISRLEWMWMGTEPKGVTRRSEDRSGGEECVGTGGAGGWPGQKKKK